MKTGDAVRMRITELRKERGMSKYRLARNTLLPPSTIKSVLDGKSGAPQVDTITIICHGIGITLREFYNSPLFEDLDMAGEDALKRE